MHDMLIERENTRLHQENVTLKGIIKTPGRLGDLIGKSPAMQQVYEGILTAARTGKPVLLLGETGTGKDLAARTIHQLSDRARNAFVPVNCGTLTATLADSLLFGHRQGAFTGAGAARSGLLAQAHAGTLFLDEVGDLPFDLQIKFLQALDSGEYRPVGSTSVAHVDMRLIAATHHDLAAMLHAGTFRNDLFYRIRCLEIRMPPLRARKEDLPLLIQHVLDLSGYGQIRLPKAILAELSAYHWPGNVRELQHAICQYIVTGNLELAAVHHPPRFSFRHGIQ
jgi:transcriptional regulator with PAS, ATPase and Fis domain